MVGVSLMAAERPDETELALSADPAETTASMAEDPLLALLMITLFLVTLTAPAARFLLILSTIQLRRESMTEIKLERGMLRTSLRVTLLTETHLEPSISNFGGQLRQVIALLVQVWHSLSHFLHSPVVLAPLVIKKYPAAHFVQASSPWQLTQFPVHG